MRFKLYFSIVFIAALFISACSVNPKSNLQLSPLETQTLEIENHVGNSNIKDSLPLLENDHFIVHPFSDSVFLKQEIVDSHFDTLLVSDSLITDSLKENKRSPYFEISSIAIETLVSADSLLKVGESKQALEMLEGFVVLNPLWKEWIEKANGLIVEIQQQTSEEKKRYQSLIFQIVNMNATGASYSLVQEFADSLISLSPGDSLVLFALREKEKAFQNNLSKAEKEKTMIWERLKLDGNYDFSESEVSRMIQNYPALSDTLRLPQMLFKIAQMRLEDSEQNKKYWETHDEQKVFAEALQNIKDKKYLEAKKKFQLLKSSALRLHSIEELEKLGELYCAEQRALAANLFKQFQENKNQKTSRQIIHQAVNLLDRCLDEFPENKQRKTVIQNKQLLYQELSP